MKLKHLVAVSLVIYSVAVGMILLVGLWVIPSSQLGGLKFSATSGSTSPTEQTQSTNTQEGTSNPASQLSSSSAGTPSSTSHPSSPLSSSSTSSSGGSSPPPPSPSPNPSPNPSPTPPPTPPPPTPPPPPPPSCGSPGGTCTSAQVATHNSQSSCWVVYNGGYYIVTSYVNQHPGGKSVFNSSTCGQNITGYLNGSQSTGGQQHHHSSTAYTILNSYYVGPVSG